MVQEMILKVDFQPVTQIDENRAKLMFKTEDVQNPIYKKDKDGNIEYDEQGNPIIIGYEDTDYCNVLVEYYRGQRTEAAMRKLIEDWYNPEIDAKIESGFVWEKPKLGGDPEKYPVWLDAENRFNYKAAWDLAYQTQGANLPLTFKLGLPDKPVYYTFEKGKLEELQDFYLKATAYVNQCLQEGWQKKEAFDWSLYVDTPVTVQS